MERNPMEAPQSSPEESSGSEKERSVVEEHERLADQRVAEAFRKTLETEEERLKKDPTLEAKGRKFGIVNEVDYLVARAQMRERIAEEILLHVREADDYWQEKAAAKLVAFERRTQDMFELYAEAKLYHPEMAETLETEHPYLKDIYEEAKRAWFTRKETS